MSGPDDAVTPQAIARCEQVIRPYIRRTPVIEVDGSEFGLPAGALTLKLELLQHSGSFKARGAFTNLLTREIPEAGIVAASGGNHGAAVAYAAMRLGKPAKIFIPSVSSPAKIARIREYGADLAVEGRGLCRGARRQREHGRGKPARCRSRHSIRTKPSWARERSALELETQAPDIDTVLVSVGGGGLVAGIAAWYAGRIKVIGVEPKASPTLTRALEAGHPVDAEAGGLAAEFAGAAPRRRTGVSDRPEIRAANRAGIRRCDRRSAEDAVARLAHRGGAGRRRRILRDPSGAYRPAAGERVAVVISGGNTTAVNFDVTR